VSRTAALLLALAAMAAAGPKVILVDGTEYADARLLDGTRATVRLQRVDRTTFELPTANLVSVHEAPPAAGSARPFNLYLHNGDRLRGEVKGDGGGLLLHGPGVEKLRVPLERVKAVRFGRLLASLQAKYSEIFAKELRRGRDVVVVQRETRPFPVYARVLSLGPKALTVRIGDEKRDLPFHKVYGFVRTREHEGAPDEGLRVRVHLVKGGRITLPLERITADAILGGKARVLREHAARLEFLGSHIAHLSEFDPIAVEEVALFGRAARWRRDGMVLGGPLRLGGTTYERGLGVQAYSRLEFVLGARWNHFFVRCGIDDAAGREGEALFRIHADGKVRQEVRRRRGQPPQSVHLDVKGVDRLVLEAVPGESYTSDFCDWADARVFNAAPLQEPPEKGQ
jgi:hypothetical protein